MPRDADRFTASEHVRTCEQECIPLHNTLESGELGLLYWSDFDTLLYAEALGLIGFDMRVCVWTCSCVTSQIGLDYGEVLRSKNNPPPCNVHKTRLPAFY